MQSPAPPAPEAGRRPGGAPSTALFVDPRSPRDIMARMIENLDDLGAKLADRVKEARLKIEGPVSTDLGYGGAPVLTFWSGDRRIHFSFGSHEGAVAVLIEVVDRGAESGARV